MQQEFYKLALKEKAEGRTVFLSSHILAEVEAICDRVSIIREGEIIVTEKMSTFKRKTGKIMTVTFEKKVDPKAFRDIQGITKVYVKEEKKNTLEMTVASNIGEVIKALSKHDIKDLDYKETSLEHLFLHFYGQTEVRNVAKDEEVEA
jgi:ABC-2 type transport system ATP-binding protein